MMTGVENMWINIGRHQMHLPTGNPQRLRGTIGLIVPNLDALIQRLNRVAPLLSDTRFGFENHGDFVAVTCPWRNRFRCHAPSSEVGSVSLGLPYVEFNVEPKTVSGIAGGDGGTVETRKGSVTASIRTGRNQYLVFRESDEPLTVYDGHHIQIYIAGFLTPYRWLGDRNLITRETNADEWRFRDICDTRTNQVLFTAEHEVRSLNHPLFGRPLINRNPAQDNRHYVAMTPSWDRSSQSAIRSPLEARFSNGAVADLSE
jgi:hypothetical protein